MNTLITGANGFIGRYLVRHILDSSPEESIFSVGRVKPDIDGINHSMCDLLDEPRLEKMVRKIRPDRVYHLAGASRVTGRIPMPEYFTKNFLTTVSLLKALKPLASPVSFFFSSSVHVYGNQIEPVTEESTVHPDTLYGFSKYLAEEALRRFAQESATLRVTIGRLYTCIGPGQSAGFVVSDLSRRIAGLPLKKSEDAANVLVTGPLDGYRSFQDVRDVVRFFPKLLSTSSDSRCEVLNITSPHEKQIREVLELLLKISGKSPQIISNEGPEANGFLGLRVRGGRLEKRVPELKFRPLEDTLRDTYAAAQLESESTPPRK